MASNKFVVPSAESETMASSDSSGPLMQLRQQLQADMQAAVREAMSAVRTDILKELTGHAGTSSPASTSASVETQSISGMFDAARANIRQALRRDSTDRPGSSGLHAAHKGKAGPTREQPGSSRSQKRKLSDSDSEPVQEDDSDNVSMRSYISTGDKADDEPVDFLLGELSSRTAVEEGRALQHAGLAKKLGHTWHASTTKAALAEISARNKHPSNVPQLRVQKLNEPIYNAVNSSQQDRDRAMQRKQRLISQAAIPVTYLMDQLMSMKPGDTVTAEQLTSLKTYALDSFSLLSVANASEVANRKQVAISNLSCQRFEVDNFDDREGTHLFSDASMRSLKPALKRAYAKSKPASTATTSSSQQNWKRSSEGWSKNFQARPKFSKHPSRGGPHKRGQGKKQA